MDPPHDQIDGLNGTLTYEWGPNGHPDRWSGGSPGFSALTLHWDGDTPLFITDNNGTLQEIKIEGIGFYAPSASTPMTFLDRNQAGFVVASHTSSGPGLWTAASPFHQTCDGVGVSGYALFEPGPDGVTDTVNTIQGVRSYDPAMGTWTTPDAYAGDASDPMSKKSYMWNRNNAFAYSDSSGFKVEPAVDNAIQNLVNAYADKFAGEFKDNPMKFLQDMESELNSDELGFKFKIQTIRGNPELRGSYMGRSYDIHYSNKPQTGLRLRYRASGGGSDTVSTARSWKNGKFDGSESLLRNGAEIRPADLDTGEPIEGGGELGPGEGEEPPMVINPDAGLRAWDSATSEGPGYR